MSEPSYQVVARSLRARIESGGLAVGEQVPTESMLALEFGVSRQTVRRAFQDLVADGLVERTRGRGTFVRGGASGYVRQVGSVDDLMNLSVDTRMQVVQPLARGVDRATADRLRLGEDTVSRLVFLRLHEGTPFCLTTVSLPPAVARLLRDVPELTSAGTTSDLTIIGLLDRLLPRRIGEAQQSITVGTVPAGAAPHLGAQPGAPTLLVERLYLDTDGEVVELAVSHFLPEHYSYRVRLHRG